MLQPILQILQASCSFILWYFQMRHKFTINTRCRIYGTFQIFDSWGGMYCLYCILLILLIHPGGSYSIKLFLVNLTDIPRYKK